MAKRLREPSGDRDVCSQAELEAACSEEASASQSQSQSQTAAQLGAMLEEAWGDRQHGSDKDQGQQQAQEQEQAHEQLRSSAAQSQPQPQLHSDLSMPVPSAGGGAAPPAREGRPHRKDRARPTHFVAVRLTDRKLNRQVRQIQRAFTDKDAAYQRCLVPIVRLHTALLLTALDGEELSLAREACQEAGRRIRAYLGGETVKLVATGLGCFREEVLHLELRSEPPELLGAIHHLLAQSFLRRGLPVLDEAGQQWIASGEGPQRRCSSHATLLKVTRGMARARTNEEWHQSKALKIHDEDLAWRGVQDLGAQICTSFELLSMLGMAKDGYYPRLQSIPICNKAQACANPAEAVQEAWDTYQAASSSSTTSASSSSSAMCSSSTSLVPASAAPSTHSTAAPAATEAIVEPAATAAESAASARAAVLTSLASMKESASAPAFALEAVPCSSPSRNISETHMDSPELPPQKKMRSSRGRNVPNPLLMDSEQGLDGWGSHLGAFGSDIWRQVSQLLVLDSLRSIAATSRSALRSVQQCCGQTLKVALFSIACGRHPNGAARTIDGACDPMAEWPVALRDWMGFISQQASDCLHVDLAFAPEAQDRLFGRGIEALSGLVRAALPSVFGRRDDVKVVVDSVRNLSTVPTKSIADTLRLLRPRVVGMEGLAAIDLIGWSSCARTLRDAQVLVHSFLGADLEDAGHFAALLHELPHALRGLDFQNIACPMSHFPVELLPLSCRAFGTVVLQRKTHAANVRGSMCFADFVATFPSFPPRVAIVRAALGSEGEWIHSGEVVADQFLAKFPGLELLQLELSLRPSAAATDVPFAELARRLIERGVRVEVTKLHCRAVQYEFLRAALHNAGASVLQTDEDDCISAYPFSHPKYLWPLEGIHAASKVL